MASGSSWTVRPSGRRKRGPLPRTWLAEWISDSPRVPCETIRMPIMAQSYNEPMDRKTPRPTDITLHQKSRSLEVKFDDGREFSLPVEYLRVFSPSAEVRGHGPGQEVLQAGQRAVDIPPLAPLAVSPLNFALPPPTHTAL